MKRTQAGLFEFCAPTGKAWCDLAVYRGADDSVLVLCAECPDNPGISITNFAGELATMIWHTTGRPSAFTWVEHYPDAARPKYGETLDLVTFNLAHDQLTRCRWQPRTRDAVAPVLAGAGVADQADWQSIRPAALAVEEAGLLC